MTTTTTTNGLSVTIKSYKALKFRLANKRYKALQYDIKVINDVNLTKKQALIIKAKKVNSKVDITKLASYPNNRINAYIKAIINRDNARTLRGIKKEIQFNSSAKTEDLFTQKDTKIKKLKKITEELTTLNKELFNQITEDMKQAKLMDVNKHYTNKQILSHIRNTYNRDDKNIDLAFYVISEKLDIDYSLPLTTIKRIVTLHKDKRITKGQLKKTKGNDLLTLLALTVKRFNAIIKGHNNARIVAKANKLDFSDLSK